MRSNRLAFFIGNFPTYSRIKKLRIGLAAFIGSALIAGVIITQVNAAGGGTTYTWTPTIGGDWTLAANWTPARTVPADNDILIINTGSSPTITNVPSLTGSQTIGALHILNGTLVTLTAASGGGQLTISDGAPSDLQIDASSSLTFAGTDPLTITVAGGSTGTVAGQVAMQEGAHQLLVTGGGTVTFSGPNAFTTAPDYSATTNPFGTGSGGNGSNNSIIFANGAAYTHSNGLSPFGTSGNSVVVFQQGSEARFLTVTGFEANGRTYANLAIGKTDPGGVAVNVSDSGTGDFQFDDLFLNNTDTADSSLTFTGSGTNTVNIKGNIRSTGAGIIDSGTLANCTITSGSGGIQINKQGGGTITFDNVGNSRSILFQSNASVAGATTLSLGRLLQMGFPSPTPVLTVDGSLNANVGATGYVVGNVRRNFFSVGSGFTFTFHVGTPNGYSPVAANNVNVSTPALASLTARANQGKLPAISGANALNRYWTLSGSDMIADLTFQYLDVSPGVDVVGTETNYQVFKYNGSFSVPANQSVDATANTATVTGVSSFSDWTLAEPGAVQSGTLAFSGAPYSDSETNADHTFTVNVSRTGGSDGAVSVNYAVTDGTATLANNDYSVSPASGTLNWAAGDTADKSFDITIKGDTTFELNETINLTLSAPTGGATIGGTNPTTLTITNDDSIGTNGGKIAFTSERDGNREVYVMNADGSNTVNLSNFPAAQDQDPSFPADASKIVFSSNRDGNYEIYVMNPDGSNQVRLTNNLLTDFDPTFSADGSKIAFWRSALSGANPEIYIMNADGTNQVNLSNNPAQEFNPSFSPDGSKIAFTSTRDGNFEIYVMNVDGSNPIRLTTTGNGVVDGFPTFSPDGSKIAFVSEPSNQDDIYIMNSDGTNPVRLTTNAGADSYPAFSPDGSQIAFSSNRDGNYEIYVMNVNGSSQTRLTTNAALDFSPAWAPGNVVTLSINDVTEAEGDSGQTAFTFTVTKTGDTSQTVTVNFQTQDGSATIADNDYQTNSGTLTFGPSDTTMPVTVQVNGDTVHETNETFTVRLSNAAGAAISDADGLGTITNDDAAPTFAIGDVTQVETDSGTTNFDFTVTKTGDTALDSVITYSTVDGTATSPSDFAAATAQTITILAASASGTITIAVNGDTLNEADETFTVNMSNATNGTITDADGLGTITNDDAAPSFTIDDVTHNEGDSGTTSYTFTVTKSGSTALNASVDYSTADDSATSPDDFTAIPTTSLVFLPADTSKEVTVLVNGDINFEPNEQFFVNLSNPTNATILDNQGVGTITNDEATVDISINDVFVAEPTAGTSTATFNVTLSAAAGDNVTVDYSTQDGSATAPDDYDAINPPQQLTFTPGQTSQPVTVTIKADGLVEGPHNFFVKLANQSSNSVIVDDTGEGTITDPPAAGNLLISEFRFRGADGPLDEYIELYNNTNAAITVATIDGSDGWSLTALNTAGTAPNELVFIPNGTVIPARGHMLVTNNSSSGGYSLSGYAAADSSYTFDIADDAGAAIFSTTNPANFTTAFRLDAAGFAGPVGAAADLHREGTGLISPGAVDGQYAFVRKLATGLPQDTDDNAADFDVVAPDGGTYGPLTAILGAPGPENCGCYPGNLFTDHSPVQRNAGIKASLIDPAVNSNSEPNRVRDTTANGCGGPNCALGTLEIRRRFKNNTGVPVTRLRFRVVDITTLNTPNPGGAQSDVRWLSSSDLVVTTSGGPVTARGTVIEVPPPQTLGGGLNSSGAVTLPGGALVPNATIDVRFLIGIQQSGRFRFLINIEALP